MKRAVLLLFVFVLPVLAQHEHHQMRMGSDAKLTAHDDAAARVVEVTLGPIALPANTAHDQLPQPAPAVFAVPIDGWFTAYHPQLVDAQGQPIPGRMLHHVAFWNTARGDFLCPAKPEHIFGAGGEMNDWPALPGFGYRVHPGDAIRVTTMFHNPTATSYPAAYLKVRIAYQPAGAEPLHSVYPAWFDVKKCGDSSFRVGSVPMTLQADIPVHYSGRLLGVGGHMHDYGQQLVLRNATTGEPIASLDATLDAQGHLRSMPIVTFAERGGFPLHSGEVLQVTGRYGAARDPDAEGMAIVVGYFLPDNDADMQALAKTPPGAKPAPGGNSEAHRH